MNRREPRGSRFLGLVLLVFFQGTSNIKMEVLILLLCLSNYVGNTRDVRLADDLTLLDILSFIEINHLTTSNQPGRLTSRDNVPSTLFQ